MSNNYINHDIIIHVTPKTITSLGIAIIDSNQMHELIIQNNNRMTFSAMFDLE